MKRMVPTEQIDLLESLAKQGVTPERIAGIEADVSDTQKMIADEYDATATYAVGDVCIHDGKLYQCNTAIGTAEAWTAAHWTEIQVSELFRMENIIDEDGHKRFQEWEGVVATDIEGLTFTYHNVSLSGTHIMFVLAGTATNGTVIPASKNILSVTLPEWIRNKIIPVWQSIWIERKNINLYADNWSSQTLNVIFGKFVDNTMKIQTTDALTLTADRSFRVQFDLLID